MTVVANALDQLCVDLTAMGVRATQDPREVNAPGAWVLPVKAQSHYLAGGVVIDVDVYLIAPDHGYQRSTRVLSELFDLTRSLVDIDDTSFVDAVTLPAGGAPLPAWRITTTLQIC